MALWQEMTLRALIFNFFYYVSCFWYFKRLKINFTKKFIKDNSCTTTYSKCVLCFVRMKLPNRLLERF